VGYRYQATGCVSRRARLAAVNVPSGAKGKPRMDAQLLEDLSGIRCVGVLLRKLIEPSLKLCCKVVAEFQLVFEASGRLFEQHGLLGKELSRHTTAAKVCD